MNEVRLGLDSTRRRRADSERDRRPPRPESAEPKRTVLTLIPSGSLEQHGEPRSLGASGIADQLAASGWYRSLRRGVLSLDSARHTDKIGRLTAAPNAALSAVAFAKVGSTLGASAAGGSQLGPYASGTAFTADIEDGTPTVPDFAPAWHAMSSSSRPRGPRH